jgi:predicted dienelactone hydrolase
MSMQPSRINSLAAALAFALTSCLPALAADCNGRHSAGYRVLALDNGRKVAVWYPTAAAEQPAAQSRSAGGFASSVARDAPPAACPRVPLVLFSHGLGGCALQSIFVTEELARHGYVVAAPDHADATCAIGSDELKPQNMRTDKPLLDPASWDDRSEIGRLHDLRAVIQLVAADAQLARIADTSRIGAVGHSLGGYTVLGMAGAWPSWKTPEVKAVLAFSPYVAPFMVRGTLTRMQVPVMYQGGSLDWGMTTSLEGPRGAYALSTPPKFFVKLTDGTHLEWTNLACAGQPNVAACLNARPNARLIDRYGIAFLDRYLKDKSGKLLTAPGRGLSAYRFALE